MDRVLRTSINFGITRIDSIDKRGKRTRCWWVRLFNHRGRPGVQGSFADARWGSKKAALLAARAFRDHHLERVQHGRY